MHLDVIDLRKFYYRTKLGRIVQRALRVQIAKLFGETKGQTVVGFGFAAPLLRPFIGSARRVICLMPGQQGVMPWPDNEPNMSVLVEDTAWPLATGFVDKMVVLHGLETCDHRGDLLDEIWRVLGPGGKVVFIVPYRSGLWARSDKTPFGYGNPYSASQLDHQLRAHRFVPERHEAALYFAPSERPFWLRMAKFWEGFGLWKILPLMAGVIVVEASKQVHARPQGGLGAVVRKPLRALDGIAKPSKEPISGKTGKACDDPS